MVRREASIQTKLLQPDPDAKRAGFFDQKNCDRMAKDAFFLLGQFIFDWILLADRELDGTNFYMICI